MTRWICVAAAVPLFAACAHSSKNVAAEAPPPAPAVAAAPVVAAAPAVAPAPQACTADEQCSAKELCVSSRCVGITPFLTECQASTHFDFDRSDLHSADLPRLQRVARCLNALPEQRALVEGNCDERGTVQYNIALGFRRAHEVAKYLEDLGVRSGDLSEVSYGKELPLCTDSTESCWAMNRRADVNKGAEAKDVASRVRADERRERASGTPAASGDGGTASAHGRRPPSKQQAATPSSSAPSK